MENPLSPPSLEAILLLREERILRKQLPNFSRKVKNIWECPLCQLALYQETIDKTFPACRSLAETKNTEKRMLLHLSPAADANKQECAIWRFSLFLSPSFPIFFRELGLGKIFFPFFFTPPSPHAIQKAAAAI